jgi:hypothetical protein
MTTEPLRPCQHLSCFIVDDAVAIDAGSLAMAASAFRKDKFETLF